MTSYTLDNVGNITSAGSTKMTYDSDSRLTSIDDQKTTSDSDGNLTDYTINGKSHKAVYNSQNQLTNFDGTTYQYDANGNRVKQNNASYVYDDSGNLLSDSDNTYIYGATGLIGYYDNANNFHTNVYDNRGDVVNVLDNQGNVSGTISYGDYGNVVKTTGTIAKTPFKYAGQYGAITDDNGLVYLKTRYYNPALMRFMNRDTVAGSITDSQSLNRFSYVEGNPLTYVDLNGQARTWLSSNYDLVHGALDVLGFVPVLCTATSALSIGLDLATGHPENVMLDSLGLIPVAGVGLHLGARAVVDGVKATRSVKDTRNAYEVAVRSKNEVANVVKHKTDFYVKPNGDTLPATGYRYMNSKYEDITRKTMSVPYSEFGHYVTFKKMGRASEVRNRCQINPTWSDASVRGEFDTLQIMDNIRIPKTFGDEGTELEPIISAYPEHGVGGLPQVLTNKSIKFTEIARLDE